LKDIGFKMSDWQREQAGTLPKSAQPKAAPSGNATIDAAVARTDSPATSVEPVRATFIRLLWATGKESLVKTLAREPVNAAAVRRARASLNTAGRTYYDLLARAAGAKVQRDGEAEAKASPAIQAAQAKQREKLAAKYADKPGGLSFETFDDAAAKSETSEQWASLSGLWSWVTASPLRMGGALLVSALVAKKVMK
jgi:hypothetical protein